MTELNNFINEWKQDDLQLRPAFLAYKAFLESLPGVQLDFKARPGISYSLRAKDEKQKGRDLFVLVDIIDDEPNARWLSVCFYNDMVTDPKEAGDFVPQGLLGEDARCFNLDAANADAEKYIFKRMQEAAGKAHE